MTERPEFGWGRIAGQDVAHLIAATRAGGKIVAVMACADDPYPLRYARSAVTARYLCPVCARASGAIPAELLVLPAPPVP